MLKMPLEAADFTGVLKEFQIQLSIDPARVLDRQVISGEVAAGRVLAPGTRLER
jgi:hypothetical protein